MPRATHPPVAGDARLTLVTLGRAELRLAREGDEPGAVLDAGKPLALVAFLAASPNRSATREHLLDLLWADLEPDGARHTLRQTLWYLRRTLGDTWLTAAGDRITLGAMVECDRDAFLAAVER